MMSEKELLSVVTAILYTRGKGGIGECVSEADHLIQAVDRYERPAPKKVEDGPPVALFEHLIDLPEGA
jgi:hypothetical protein